MAARTKSKEVTSALRSLKAMLPALAAISAVTNILALTGSIYMLQVYDRVLSSRSVPTLLVLSALAIGLYLFQGGLEVIRGQILVRLGSRLDRKLAPLAHDAVMRLPLYGSRTSALQPIRDVDAIRGFLSGQGPIAILDMPWMPVYIAFAFFLHPLLGVITLAGAIILLSLTVATERRIKEPARIAFEAARQRTMIADASEQNAEVLRAMGFGPRFMERFAKANAEHLSSQERLGDMSGGMSAVSKMFRLILQSALLGAGAYLALRGELTAGAIIAASIAASRALAPIEIAIANWRSLVAARQSCARLDAVLSSLPAEQEPLALPAPDKSLRVENITLNVPGSQRIVLSNVNFEVAAGQVLAVIGPSAAGKSSLARALTGVWPLARGAVRLDAAALDRWSVEELGKHIGYLPQNVQLFDGTITENITRFEDNPESGDVIAACQAANVHEMIVRLPNGYETLVGQQGEALSAGQRQRIALARALYKTPFFLVLDEPNSNLDAEGEAALASALDSVKARGGIAVVIAHRPSVLASADLVAVLGAGQLTAFGLRDETLRKVCPPNVRQIVPAAATRKA